ncbi:hypothetical protein BT93_L5627 [Corymbia citriodora subsp. variegata]|uniref:Twinfilin n=1 Tax=Corymbia citriodora subsp. variegata TaxID=360336 RepID=A0A8T0CGY9_CORYI|nr:hypothetical protein BT93_L5627 [Corymbia citriodora subsp. variegata]
MQSGITASQELLDAFNTLVSSSSQRALLATIDKETLVPSSTLQSSSTFTSDLDALVPLLTPIAASYILLKLDGSASDGYVAVTYVPDTAPVRQKMLFASTRLTLVRELGVERFRETLFVTRAQELSKEGWEKHEKHAALAAPLTEEEEGLKGIREQEAAEGGGTGARRSHVSAGVGLEMDESGLKALEGLKSAAEGALVQIKIDVKSERLLLDSESTASPAELSSKIEATEPRYSFYRYPGHEGVLFMYSCPSQSKIKERMVYASSRARLVNIAEQEVGLQILKRFEASSPSEWTEDVLAGEFEEKKVESRGFARPKRPGRR